MSTRYKLLTKSGKTRHWLLSTDDPNFFWHGPDDMTTLGGITGASAQTMLEAWARLVAKGRYTMSTTEENDW